MTWSTSLTMKGGVMIATVARPREEYARVTEILAHFSGIDKVPNDILEKAAARGDLVHKLCIAYVEGIAPANDITEVEGYLKSFLQWFKEDYKVLTTEERFYDDELQITGQVDMIIENKGKIILIDFKTSASPQKTWPLQLSAYKYMANEKYKIDEIQIVQLKKDGSVPQIHIHGSKVDLELFFHCYGVFKYFYENKRKQK